MSQEVSSSSPFPGLQPGIVLAERYELTQCLGSGAHGAVYLCRDQLLGGLPVAVKLFRPAAMRLAASLRGRIATEARAANGVVHDNVVRFYELLERPSYIGIVMEYVEGRDLRSVVSSQGLLDIGFAVDVVRQVSRGLRAVHLRNILHRDLKPENLILGADGIVKIADFGVAAFLQESRRMADVLRLLQQGAVSRPQESDKLFGTPEYLAPELFEGAPYTVSSDIYALGAVMFELITGRHPFDYDDTEDLLTQKLDGQPAAPIALRGDCPQALSDLCLRTLARDPDERVQSLDELCHELRDIVRDNAPLAAGVCVKQSDWSLAGEVSSSDPLRLVLNFISALNPFRFVPGLSSNEAGAPIALIVIAVAILGAWQLPRHWKTTPAQRQEQLFSSVPTGAQVPGPSAHHGVLVVRPLGPTHARSLVKRVRSLTYALPVFPRSFRAVEVPSFKAGLRDTARRLSRLGLSFSARSALQMRTHAARRGLRKLLQHQSEGQGGRRRAQLAKQLTRLTDSLQRVAKERQPLGAL